MQCGKGDYRFDKVQERHIMGSIRIKEWGVRVGPRGALWGALRGSGGGALGRPRA